MLVDAVVGLPDVATAPLELLDDWAAPLAKTGGVTAAAVADEGPAPADDPVLPDCEVLDRLPAGCLGSSCLLLFVHIVEVSLA